ncbi:glycosyltransferase family 2 protein [Patescibacteria group bacterium]|nr:glycosyltransferase family 2 protein [Patescibacteria group bacterium]MCL5114896.1 glycosyltransferase family 2 protein [Patescibacteria group bacterium]
MKVSIILPCRDERDMVGSVVKEALEALKKNGIDGEIIVSDSSTDGSAEIARAAGARVVEHGKEGYGLAIKAGLNMATGDVAVSADADGAHDLEALPELVKALDHSDIAIGSRFDGNIEDGAMPLLHRILGTPLLNVLLFVFFGIRVSDSQSGFKAVRTATFKKLDSEIKSTAFTYNTEMLIKAKKAGLKISEVPIHCRPRRGNPKLRTYRDGTANIKYILMLAPFIFYAAVGGALFLLGAAELATRSLLPAFLNRPTVTIFFPLLGVQIIFLGLFVKTYAVTKLGERMSFIDSFYRAGKQKLLLVLGGLLIIVPAALRLFGLAGDHFDILLVSAVIGLQVVFNVGILSTLSVK